MIKLTRPSPPLPLTALEVAALTSEYISKGTSVWNKKYIREALLEFSSDKCAYCETLIGEESKYLEVDHFYCKSIYPNRVVEWSNLLPSCKRCNIAKLDHDVAIDGMLLDPTVESPPKHLKMINYRIFGRTDIGELTERELDLNNPRRLTLPRLRIGDATAVALKRARDDLQDYMTSKPTIRQMNKVKRGLTNVLLEAAPEAAYSATTATVIATSPDYAWIVSELKKQGLWSPELAQAAQVAELASLAP